MQHLMLDHVGLLSKCFITNGTLVRFQTCNENNSESMQAPTITRDYLDWRGIGWERWDGMEVTFFKGDWDC